MSFSNRTEFEYLQRAYNQRAEEANLSCVTCPKCQGQWFEQVEFKRFLSEHNLILGQPVPAKAGSIPFIMLRCGSCGHCIEPNIIHQNRDRDYDNFLDTMNGKTSGADSIAIPSIKV